MKKDLNLDSRKKVKTAKSQLISAFFKPVIKETPKETPVELPVIIQESPMQDIQESPIQDQMTAEQQAVDNVVQDNDVMILDPEQDNELKNHETVQASSNEIKCLSDDDPIVQVVSDQRPKREARNRSKALIFDHLDQSEKVEITSNSDAPVKKPSTKSTTSTKPFFFLSKKEKQEQIQIQKSLKMRNSLLETSKLSNNIIQADPNTINPFFAVRQSSKTTNPLKENLSTLQLHSSSTPWPSSEQMHVGWNSTPRTSIEEYLWKPRQDSIQEESILSETLDFSLAKLFKSNPIRQGSENITSKTIELEQVVELLRCDYPCLLSDDQPYHFYLLSDSKLPMRATQQTQLWASTFKASNYEMIFEKSNRKTCLEVIDWLQAWEDNPERFTAFKSDLKKSKKKPKRKRDDFLASDSEDEISAYISDGDICGSYDAADALAYHPVVVLVGPVSSGKSSIAHSAAFDAGYHVLEVSASDRRSGKALNDVLAAATTMHTVQKRKKSFFENENDLGIYFRPKTFNN